tara:strand:- start:1548 stop:1676 length:129 start_codon:yes stop_codon:yes gene_type:complete
MVSMIIIKIQGAKIYLKYKDKNSNYILKLVSEFITSVRKKFA